MLGLFSMRSFIAISILFLSITSVGAIDQRLVQQNTKLSKKISSLNIRLNKLDTLLNNGQYQAFKQKAKIANRIQKILFTRFEVVNEISLSQEFSKLGPSLKALRRSQISSFEAIVNDLENNNAILTLALAQAKASNIGLTTDATGLFGQVKLIEGNCMPMIEGSKSSCSETGFASTVIIRDTLGELISETETDENGYYAVELAPGDYSVWLNDSGEEYCNWYSGDGLACKVEIVDILNYDPKIDHAAW
jgi:hypothetical protein